MAVRRPNLEFTIDGEDLMAKALKGEMASCPRSISIHPNISNG